MFRTTAFISALLAMQFGLAMQNFGAPPSRAEASAWGFSKPRVLAAAEITDAQAAAYAVEGQARAVRNDFAGAHESFTKAIALESDNRRRALYFIMRGFLAGQGADGHTDRAISDINEGMGIDPTLQSVGYGLRSLIWLERKDYDRAIADCTEQIRLLNKPGDNPSEALRVCGLAWLGEKDMLKAVDYFNRSLQRDPGRTEAIVDRGIAYTAQNQLERTLADYDAALRQNPKNALALYARGVTKLKRGDPTGNADITAAMALDPGIARKFEGIAGR